MTDEMAVRESLCDHGRRMGKCENQWCVNYAHPSYLAATKKPGAREVTCGGEQGVMYLIGESRCRA